MAISETDTKNNALDFAVKNSPLTIDQLCDCLECNRVTLWRIVNNKHSKLLPRRRKLIIQLCALLHYDPKAFGFKL